jgi:hypothetical protein
LSTLSYYERIKANGDASMKSLFITCCALLSYPLFAQGPAPELIIVAPLCKATEAWNQTGPMNANVHQEMNLLCGCDPLAWGQVITYHGLNGAPAADWTFTPQTYPVCIYNADGSLLRMEHRTTSAIAYNWEDVRDQGPDAGRLMYDLGVLARTAYRPNLASGTFHRSIAKSYFGYKSQGWCYTFPLYSVGEKMCVQPDWESVILPQVRASLQAGAPMVVSLMIPTGGHAVICDGYGYAKDGTELFHFHYGWGTTSGGWKPASWWTSQNGKDPFQAVNINVHPEAIGCVLAGRVTLGGSSIQGANLTLLETGATTSTDATGSYCFTGLSENTTYTLRVEAKGNPTLTQTLTTGTFVDDQLRQKLQDQWEETHGKENRHRVPLQGGNVILDIDLARVQQNEA